MKIHADRSKIDTHNWGNPQYASAYAYPNAESLMPSSAFNRDRVVSNRLGITEPIDRPNGYISNSPKAAQLIFIPEYDNINKTMIQSQSNLREPIGVPRTNELVQDMLKDMTVDESERKGEFQELTMLDYIELAKSFSESLAIPPAQKTRWAMIYNFLFQVSKSQKVSPQTLETLKLVEDYKKEINNVLKNPSLFSTIAPNVAPLEAQLNVGGQAVPPVVVIPSGGGGSSIANLPPPPPPPPSGASALLIIPSSSPSLDIQEEVLEVSPEELLEHAIESINSVGDETIAALVEGSENPKNAFVKKVKQIMRSDYPELVAIRSARKILIQTAKDVFDEKEPLLLMQQILKGNTKAEKKLRKYISTPEQEDELIESMKQMLKTEESKQVVELSEDVNKSIVSEVQRMFRGPILPEQRLIDAQQREQEKREQEEEEEDKGLAELGRRYDEQLQKQEEDEKKNREIFEAKLAADKPLRDTISKIYKVLKENMKQMSDIELAQQNQQAKIEGYTDYKEKILIQSKQQAINMLTKVDPEDRALNIILPTQPMVVNLEESEMDRLSRTKQLSQLAKTIATGVTSSIGDMFKKKDPESSSEVKVTDKDFSDATKLKFEADMEAQMEEAEEEEAEEAEYEEPIEAKEEQVVSGDMYDKIKEADEKLQEQYNNITVDEIIKIVNKTGMVTHVMAKFIGKIPDKDRAEKTRIYNAIINKYEEINKVQVDKKSASATRITPVRFINETNVKKPKPVEGLREFEPIKLRNKHERLPVVGDTITNLIGELKKIKGMFMDLDASNQIPSR